ncbi:penicillin-binding transpeptidase domain-containing protein, partial [Nostoc sp.]|uniref:penicillin-binding transpeptidase domain-containing protein n=1 Tax=Nostoc sp. TaxID=1180 RepID=UPI0035947ACE
PTYSLALGSNEVNLLELTSAYGSFANQGLHTEPHGITRILNRQGKVIWSANFKPKRALDADSAAIMTWMLRNVVEAGTGAAAQLGNRPVAGKTGTSDEARDLWFIGYIPQVVTGVWLGNDDNRPTYGSSGSAAYTWREFMKKAVEEMPVEKFPQRPKLDGRKGTIKAQSIKPKQVLNRSISSKDDSGESADSSSSSRRRRSRGSSSQEEQQSGNSTSRRRRRDRSEGSNSSNSSSESSTPRRRSRRVESDSPPPQRTRRSSSPANSSGSSGSSSSQPSWRDKLRPSN